MLAFAISIANRLGAKLHVLKVIPDEREKSLVEVDTHVPQATLDEYHNERAQRVKEHIEAQVAAFYAAHPEMDATQAISEITVRENDDVAELILDEAKAGHADLILMGARRDVGLVGLAVVRLGRHGCGAEIARAGAAGADTRTRKNGSGFMKILVGLVLAMLTSVCPALEEEVISYPAPGKCLRAMPPLTRPSSGLRKTKAGW